MPFDWLSRDSIEVDKYIADRLCAFPFSVQLTIDVLEALLDVAGAKRQANIPKSLPIHIMTGSRDPVSNGTRSLVRLLDDCRAADVRRVTHRFYLGARHELFNKINRDEVTPRSA
jgi:alpha-beta hydrolase superfamily lysophospholipase